ncbi:hypothetical protein ACU4GD_31920 [Cupriavidus basilensis]
MDHLSDEELAAVAVLLSSDRLSTFERLAGSNRGTIALHQEMLRLAASLMTVTAVVESALCNAVCDRLTGSSSACRSFGYATLDRPLQLGRRRTGQDHPSQEKRAEGRLRQTRPGAKRKLDGGLRSRGGVAPAGIPHEQLSKVRQAAIPVPMGQVVAQLTMYAFLGRLRSRAVEAGSQARLPGQRHRGLAWPAISESIIDLPDPEPHRPPRAGLRSPPRAQTEGTIEFVAGHLR